MSYPDLPAAEDVTRLEDIGKVAMSNTRVRTHSAQPSSGVQQPYRVAISYASENVGKVGAVANMLRQSIGLEAVFFDGFAGHAISGFDADERLREIYQRADLVVVFTDRHYAISDWCRAEWQSIRQRHRRGGDVMLFRLDDHNALGLGANDLPLDASKSSPEDLHESIVKRLSTHRAPAQSVARHVTMIALALLAAMGWVLHADEPGAQPSLNTAVTAVSRAQGQAVLSATMVKSEAHVATDSPQCVGEPEPTHRPMYRDWRRCCQNLTESEVVCIEASAKEMVERERRGDPSAWESMRNVNQQIDAIYTRRIEAWVALAKQSHTPPPPPAGIPKIGQQRGGADTKPGGTAIAKPTPRPPIEPPLENPTQRRTPALPSRIVLALLRRASDADGAPLAALSHADHAATHHPQRLRLDVRGVTAPVALVVFHAATGALVTLPPRHASGGDAGFELPAEIPAADLHLYLVELAATPNFAHLSPLRADQPLAVALRPLGA